MNINPISFKGTYIISSNNVSLYQSKKIIAKANEYNMIFEAGNYENPGQIFISVPDKSDKDVLEFFEKIKLKFEKAACLTTLTEDSITPRIILSENDKYGDKILQSINAQILDSELKKNPYLYVGYKGKNGSILKYERFKRYLMMNQQIYAPSIYFRKTGSGETETIVHDGRHRFAVLRDMGFAKIPVAISKEDIATAKELGLM